MLKRSVLVAVLPALAVPAPDVTWSVRKIAGLSGNWDTRWFSNDSHHELTLSQNGKTFSGNYTSDDGEICPVSGDVNPYNQHFALTITCSKWNIKTEGFNTLDGNMIVGRYLAYGNPKDIGGFIMTRQSKQ